MKFIYLIIFYFIMKPLFLSFFFNFTNSIMIIKILFIFLIPQISIKLSQNII